jgi:hypothetical protein
VDDSSHELARVVARAVKEESDRYRFQMARYDGDLAGTEVGMVLFYTDLLAKLWAIDFLHNQPAREVEDFHPMTDLRISPVYEDEIRRLPSTRLWFGPEDKGFQVTDKGETLLLARNATRIYAASSDPLSPGKEEAAAANSEAFLGWWNDHYMEVARLEPQYERLNQVMKWSLLISWLNDRNKGDALGFLAQADVDRGNWFPDWVRKHPGLHFRRWEKVGFHARGYKGSTTEAMPILSSDPYSEFEGVAVLSGGVSLAPKELFQARAALAEEVSPFLRRSNLNYGSRAATGRDLTFQTLQESRFTFKAPAPGQSLLEAVPKAGSKLRGRVAEIAAPTFERTVTRPTGAVEVASRVADRELAVLTVKPTKNGLRVGLRSRELAQGQSLAARASTSPDRLAAVAHHPEVEVALATRDAVLVRLRGSKNWIKLTAESSGAQAKTGGIARVADTKPGARPYDVAFVDEAAVKTAVHGSEPVVIRVSEHPGADMLVNISPRGPPPKGPSTPVEIDTGGGSLPGRFDPKTRTLTLAREEVPPALLDDPVRLIRTVRRAGLGRLEKVPNDTGVIRLTAKEVAAEESSFVHDLETGRYGPAAQELAVDPVAFARKAEGEYHQALRNCDRLLADGDTAQALTHLDALAEFFGARPEIQFRRSICDIEAGRLARAAKVGNELLGAPRGPAKLFEEINARLASPDLEPSTRSSLTALRDGATWRDLQAAGRLPEGKVTLVVEDERLDLDFHTPQLLPQGKPVPLEQVIASDAPIYVMDAPGLNNLDWSTSFGRTLESQVQGKLATVVSIPDAGIAEFRPAHIFAGETAPAKAETYTRVSDAKGWQSHSSSPSPGSAASGNGPGDDEEERKRRRARLEAELKRTAHLQALKEGQAKATGEVHLIIPAGSQ